MSIADLPAGTALPTHLDLPHTDDKPVENAYETGLGQLLTGLLTPWLDRLHPDGNYFVGADTGIYWELTPLPEDGCKAPDWYYVPNVPRLRDGILRLSYVLWNEKVHPMVVVESVSGTGAEERDATPFRGKFWVYERAIKAQYYVIYDPHRATLEVFVLSGSQYRPVPANDRGRFPIAPLGIEFGLWDGLYHGNPAEWLRAWDENGSLLPTPEEQAAAEKQRADTMGQLASAEKQRADAERQRAEVERQRADAERQKAERFAAKLRELGLDPDAV